MGDKKYKGRTIEDNCLKEDIDISKHYTKRCHKRVGLKKRAQKRFIEKAIAYGLYYDDIKHTCLLYYIQEKIIGYRQHRDVIIFNRYMLVFKENVFITVLHLPIRYCDFAHKLQKEKENKLNLGGVNL